MSWKLNDLTKLTGAPDAARRGGLDGYQTLSPNQQHVNYIGVDNHVHELVYINSWSHNDLTALANAPPAALGSPLDGYASPGQQHVNYIGTDGHVYELVYKDSWSYTNLTAAAVGAPLAAANSALDGYITSSPDQQHVNYIGIDMHVHELVYKSSWTHTDLTAAAQAPLAAAGSPLDGYRTTSPDQQHVNFIGADFHVHELVYKDSWTHTDLTGQAKAPNAGVGSALDGYMSTSPNQQHVNFIGEDQHVYELVYKDSWTVTNLTAAAGAPVAATGSPLDGYVTPGQQHVNFIGTNGHVYELWYGDSWNYNDLSQITGAVTAESASRLDGYATTFNNQQHVNFVGSDSHVHELWYQN